jgi:hypothetical protein
MKNIFHLSKKIALSLGLVILVNVFYFSGIQTYSQGPRYEDFFTPQNANVNYEEGACEEYGGTWVKAQAGAPAWCDAQAVYTAQQNAWETAQKAHQKTVFLISLPLGIFTLVLGLFAPLPMAVSSGLMYGGLLTSIIGTLGYWGQMEDYLRFTVSGLALLFLLLLGIRKFKD